MVLSKILKNFQKKQFKNEFSAMPTRSHRKLAEEKQGGDWPKDPHNLWCNPSYSSMTECPPSDRRDAGNWEHFSDKFKENLSQTAQLLITKLSL